LLSLDDSKTTKLLLDSGKASHGDQM